MLHSNLKAKTFLPITGVDAESRGENFLPKGTGPRKIRFISCVDTNPQTEWGALGNPRLPIACFFPHKAFKKTQLLPSGEPGHLPPGDNNCLWMTRYINTISCAGFSTGQDHSRVPGAHGHDEHTGGRGVDAHVRLACSTQQAAGRATQSVSKEKTVRADKVQQETDTRGPETLPTQLHESH